MSDTLPKQLHIYEHFDSLAEFAEAADERASNETRLKASSSWDDCDFPQAIDLAHQGWNAPLEQVETTLTDTAHTLEFAPTLDVAGDQVDLDLFLQGEPECMISYPLQQREVSSLSMLVPVCYSWMVDAETAKNRAIAVAAAIESFRERGISISVIAYMVIHSYDKNKPAACVTVTLADSRFAYDPGRVAFGVGHPAMLRKLMFAIEDGWSAKHKRTFDIRGGRGTEPYNLTRSVPAVRDYVFDSLNTQVSVDLPSLTTQHNSWSLDQHYKEVVSILGGKYEGEEEHCSA